MPPRNNTEGERLASLETHLQSFEKYTHERWHSLNNDLQVLLALPERVARDMGKIQGIFDGKLSAVSKELERSMEAAIGRAVKPVTDDVIELKKDISELRTEIESLKTSRNQMTGAKLVILWIVQTVVTIASSVGIVHSVH